LKEYFRFVAKVLCFFEIGKFPCPSHVSPSPRTYKEPNNRMKRTTIGRGK
jgi:hypothetical protein